MASIDTALFAESPPYTHESVTLVEHVTVSLGGKGLIAAIAMNNEGVDVAPLALVGQESRVAAMLPRGLGRDWLVPALAEDTRIWLSVSADQKVVAWVAAGRRSMGGAELEDVAARYVEVVDAVYLSFEVPELIRAALASAERTGKAIAANLSRPLIDVLVREDPALLRGLASKARILLCNVHESARILHELAARDWRDIAGSHAEVVVTDGDTGGAFSVAPFRTWERYDAAVPRGNVRSVVGAGDTFNGAFVAARWARGLPLAASCQEAAALAARCVSSPNSSILIDS